MSRHLSLVKSSSENKTIYFQMSRKFISVRTQPAGLYQSSHSMTLFKTGQKMDDNFSPPFKLILDPEIRNPLFPTFFESPALIGTKSFYQDLRTLGLSNIEAFPAEIYIERDHTINYDYLLLNIVGSIPYADMKKSKTRSLGQYEICVITEDTNCMLVSERVANHLKLCDYKDILFK
jgi:hypothetical protein